MAVHSAAARKTFFTYGGTTFADRRELSIMVSYFDHATGEVPRPVILYIDPAVDDPHDNASIQIDGDGCLWVFKSGRGTKRPGIIFRSTRPGSIDEFECVAQQEFTYPQVWHEKGFFLLFAKYKFLEGRGPARELYWKTSEDGRKWSGDHKLAGFDGHYGTSGHCDGKFATFFNWHPGSNNDRRTNVYYAQTTDFGKTWTTACGKMLQLPLSAPVNDALVLDLQAQGKNMYTCDLNFDKDGNPVLLFITSRAGEPGPPGEPREWTVLHWKDGQWKSHVVARAGHNYDMGSLYVEGGEWRVIGPAEDRPQQYGTGGEIALWLSRDEGETWSMESRLTEGSRFNHGYARRPALAADPFQAFWADGDPARLTPSHLYFADSSGAQVWCLPYDMEEDFATPRRIAGAGATPPP